MLINSPPIRFSEKEILEALQSTSHGKALGINNMPDYIATPKFTEQIYEKIKDIPDFYGFFNTNPKENHEKMLKIFSVFHALLFNRWFEEGAIPREHATAKIMFLFKESPTP